jgi:hypothetical protein
MIVLQSSHRKQTSAARSKAMTYEQMVERLGELEQTAQAALEAGELVPAAVTAEAMDLEAALEATPEYEQMIEQLG